MTPGIQYGYGAGSALERGDLPKVDITVASPPGAACAMGSHNCLIL